MLRRRTLVLVALVSVAIASTSLLVSTSRADHWSQGNIHDEVNYWLVEGDVVRVCDQSEFVSTSDIDAALAIAHDQKLAIA